MIDVPTLPTPCGGPSLAMLRRLDTGELTGTDARVARTHVDGCDSCTAVLRDFEAERAALRLSLPFPALEARIEERRRPVAGLVRRFWFALAIPAAAAFAFALIPPQTVESPIRVKGSAAIDFVVKTADGTRPGTDGEALRAGDTIRLKYATGGRAFVLIAGIDADGRVFPYLAQGDRSAAARTPSDFAPNAVTFDADPRPERVFALYSDLPISIDELKSAAADALKEAGTIERVKRLPVDAEQATVLINKAH